METVKASIVWDGPKRDILTVLVEPTPILWQADPDDEWQIALLRTLDENEQETGEIAGVEVVDFLGFDRWDDLPDIPLLWQVQSWEPLPLKELLKRTQKALQGKERKTAGVQADTRVAS